MIYYPLQLLQLAGVHEVMIVTGQGHAGQLIDLLGERAAVAARRSTSRSSTSISPTRCRSRPGGIAQVVGMAESFAGDDELIVCLGDNIFEYAEADAIRAFVDGDDGAARSSSRRCPTPSASASSSTATTARRGRGREGGRRRPRYDAPPSNDAVVGLYCYSPTSST